MSKKIAVQAAARTAKEEKEERRLVSGGRFSLPRASE
jgi:hypothetical protein